MFSCRYSFVLRFFGLDKGPAHLERKVRFVADLPYLPGSSWQGHENAFPSNVPDYEVLRISDFSPRLAAVFLPHSKYKGKNRI